jgi:alkanesulfonate monooxygenase SsuD/methylene tetrahydromethanopterin reductase-like flavin-dependent oxidoreductase (luciferase family)
MELATTVALVVLREPVALAKALAALDVSDGRVIAGLGPGSSECDYDAVGCRSRSAGGGSTRPPPRFAAS